MPSNDRSIPLIIDADTANEVDDLFAIVRALRDDRVDMRGLCSAHFRAHDEAPVDSVAESQRLNEDLLRLSRRMDVPHPAGSNRWMGKAWGGDAPADSAAVRHMIACAMAMPAGERLIIAGQGAMTNVASAIRLAPEIGPRITYYLMGFRFDRGSGIWNKNDFNVRNDLNAADFLLDTPDLDLHIMTQETSRLLVFDREETFARLGSGNPLHTYLRARWEEHCPASTVRIMWDLALIEAILHPEWAEEEEVMTPPENVQRKVKVYSAIDPIAMREDFWRVLERV